MAAGFWTKGIDPGSFRMRVTFCKQGEIEDEYGKVTNGLIDVVELSADFYPIRGQELLEVQKVQGEVTHKCYLRYHTALEDINSNWYIKYRGKQYSIESVIEAGNAKKYYEIYCKCHVNADEMPVSVDRGDSDGWD